MKSQSHTALSVFGFCRLCGLLSAFVGFVGFVGFCRCSQLCRRWSAFLAFVGFCRRCWLLSAFVGFCCLCLRLSALSAFVGFVGFCRCVMWGGGTLEGQETHTAVFPKKVLIFFISNFVSKISKNVNICRKMSTFVEK